MIFALNYLKHDIEKINEVPETFFKSCIDAQIFSNTLFPEWFVPVIEESPVLLNKFKNVFLIISKLSKPKRKNVYSKFIGNLKIESLCENSKLKPFYTKRDLPHGHESFKELFYHLYSETLQKSITFNTAIKTNIKDHYLSWKKSNPIVVCPFCGLENFTSSEGTDRDSYDHWLCKSKYPLSSINFSNLVPMGERCNKTAVKGDTDILHYTNSFRRRPSFYPYISNSGIQISLKCLNTPSVGYKGEWEITIKPVDAKETQKIKTWIEVFNLKVRYVSWVKDYLDAWKDEFIEYLKKNKITLPSTSLISELKKIIIVWKNTFLSIKVFSGVLLLEAYIDYLINQAPDFSIYAFCNIQLKT